MRASPTKSPNQRKLHRYHRAQQRSKARKQALTELSTVHGNVTHTDDKNPNSPVDQSLNDEQPCCKFILAATVSNKENVPEFKSSSHPPIHCETCMCKQMRTECQQLRTENLELRQKLQETKITEDFFRDSDKKVRYYTGLPSFLTLMIVFEFVKNFIPVSSRIALTKFQKFLLVKMKLRLNSPVQDLAYRFGISQATASRTFLSTLHILYIRLKSLIYWPGREELRLSMPMEFRKNFGLKVAVIIDCFEIFIERPSNLLARAKTWSSYKHHNTIKFLIGITPQGSISFLSKAWGGRASDKYITEHSGLLDKLQPGDLVLADRGFDIQESVGLKCAEVKIPSFMKGRKQLPALEVESTRNIAHVRIHVERVIGLARNKYTILSGTVPIDYLLSAEGDVPAIDKIVTVCCCLTNMCKSVVPFN